MNRLNSINADRPARSRKVRPDQLIVYLSFAFMIGSLLTAYLFYSTVEADELMAIQHEEYIKTLNGDNVYRKHIHARSSGEGGTHLKRMPSYLYGEVDRSKELLDRFERPPMQVPSPYDLESSSVKQLHPIAPLAAKANLTPGVAWLMSFPNSGTSFTIHMTRESSNSTTASNYALEGDIRDKPSVQAIKGPEGVNGPFLELIPDRHTTIPSTILTKTHCKGYCNLDHGRPCGPSNNVMTLRGFGLGCLSGNKAIKKDGEIVKIKVTYSPSLVTKAIHIFRHPLDNIVARFHLLFATEPGFGDTYTRDAAGFHKYCRWSDTNRDVITSPLIDEKLRLAMKKAPCFNEVFRYAQWHNLAFGTTNEFRIPTMVLHYDEYDTDFPAARDRILKFLDLPLVGTGMKFVSGKTYLDYYTQDEKKHIYELLKELSSLDTWQALEHYEF